MPVDYYGHCEHCYEDWHNGCPEMQGGKLHTRPCEEGDCEFLPRLTVSQVERAIGLPAKGWEGNCHGIAVKVLAAGLVRGRAVYGCWHGEMKGHWANRAGVPFTHHGWIALPDGNIVDPTRWSFEASEPYIYVGPMDENLYDPGGNKARRMTQRMVGVSEECPMLGPGEKLIDLKLPKGAAELVNSLMGEDPGIFTMKRIIWLANRDPGELGEYAKPVYEALIRAGQTGWIPIDNRRTVMEG